jgi:hypothetical protein
MDGVHFKYIWYDLMNVIPFCIVEITNPDKWYCLWNQTVHSLINIPIIRITVGCNKSSSKYFMHIQNEEQVQQYIEWGMKVWMIQLEQHLQQFFR